MAPSLLGRQGVRPRVLRILLCASVVLLASSAGADPESLTYRYSEYEELAIHDASLALGAAVDPSPEGKTISKIDFVRLDPIDAHDALPASVDVVHTTSRVSLLRHEILAREGDRWRGIVVDESARNLRTLPQLSLVLCIALRDPSPDRVRLVVITKDVWSLYVDFDVAATPGGLELLDLEPKETNVYGLQHTALARFVLQPRSYSLGGSYEIPRFDGRWLDLLLDGNAIINRDSGDAEGSYGSATIARPLASSRAEWAWSTGVTWKDQVTRRYSNASVVTFTQTPASALAPVQWIWRERSIVEQAKLTRSFGWEVKNDFSVGASISHAVNRVPVDASTDPAARADFQSTKVPVGEDRVGPFLQWHGYSSTFQRVLDVSSLGLQEDNRLGHDLWLRAYPILRALGSTRDLIGLYGAAAYSVPFGDGVAKGSLESTVESEPGYVSDASVTAGLGVVTPRIGIGRLVFAASALNRFRNRLNARSYLGGDTLLRGYPSRFLDGQDVVTANLEYRSRPVDLAAIQLGAAAFYDVGDALDGFDHLDPKHSVGLGLRVVFPQIDRAVLRLDFGFPLERPIDPSTGQPIAPMSFFIAFHQVVALPVVGSGF
jgi:hypothetical protein